MTDLVLTRRRQRNKARSLNLTLFIWQFILIVALGTCIIENESRDTEIAKLSSDNEDLREVVDQLVTKVGTLESDLSNLHISDMNMQTKLTDIDTMLTTIETDHNEINDTVEELKEIKLFSSEMVPNSGEEPTFNPYDVTELSNLTVDQLEIITIGTRFVGYEQELLTLEREYNINVIFAIANSIQECGWLDTNSYTDRHNYFGFKGRPPFNSMSHCLEYYFSWINSYYVTDRGLTTIQTIQPVYCPDDTNWDESITRIGNKLINKLQVTLE